MIIVVGGILATTLPRQVFDETKVDDPNNHGYGGLMDNSSVVRGDIADLTKQSGSKFNRQIMVYKNPTEIDSCSDNVAKLGQGKINDFSSGTSTKGLKYADYQIAHSDAEAPKGKVVQRTLSALEVERSRSVPKMTDEDIAAANDEKKNADIDEMNRQYRQHQRDQEIFRNYQMAQPMFQQMKK